ncbi:MAG: hypothetical protein WCJ26_10000 [bacterium]
MITLGWIGGMWINKERWTYAYNGNNLTTESLQQMWEGASWQNKLKILQAYDGNSNRVEENLKKWTGAWQDSTFA